MTLTYLQLLKNYANYGEEATFGGGKSIRDGMAQNLTLRDDRKVADLVLTNACYRL